MSNQELITHFEASGRIKGKYEKPIPIEAVFKVKQEKTELNASVQSVRPADAKCIDSDGNVWLFMASSELSFSVLGELLTFFNLYMEKHSHDKRPRLGIVCEKTSGQVAWLCGKFGVDVFQLLTNGSAERIESKLLQ